MYPKLVKHVKRMYPENIASTEWQLYNTIRPRFKFVCIGRKRWNVINNKRETSRSSESCCNRRKYQADNIFQQKQTYKLACEVELGKLLR